jgi:hypothetical protein
MVWCVTYFELLMHKHLFMVIVGFQTFFEELLKEKTIVVPGGFGIVNVHGCSLTYQYHRHFLRDQPFAQA